MNGPAQQNIQIWARIGGALFLISLVAGGFGEGIAPGALLAPGDAAATAHNVASSDALLRGGFASYLVEALCDVALTAILYVLLRPVGRVIALHAVLFRVMATATFAFAELFYFVPTLILAGDAHLKGFSTDQLNALTLLSLRVYDLGGVISLVFYGTGSMLTGYLMYRSGYLPRALGVLWAVGGAGFFLRTFAYVLAPALPTAILQAPTILALPFLAGWLLIKGVDAARWEAKARASEGPVLA